MKTRFLRDKEGKIDKNYVISEDGSYIRDKRTGEKLKNIYVDRHNGYRVITITINGKYYNWIKISILQWLAWRGIIPKGFDIHHKKFSRNKKINKKLKLNDHIDNLDCMPNAEHTKYHMTGNKYLLGRTGEKSSRWGKHFSHTEEYKKEKSRSMLGEKNHFYGKHHTKESNQKNRESHIGLQAGEKHPMFGVHRFGENAPNVKITDDKVEEIRILGYIDHLSQSNIAKKVGTTESNVNAILQGYSRNPDHLSKSELISQTKEKFSRKKSFFREGYILI